MVSWATYAGELGLFSYAYVDVADVAYREYILSLNEERWWRGKE